MRDGRRCRSLFGDDGASLLEALVAMTIMAAVALAMIGLTRQSLAGISAAADVDGDWLRADRLFRAMSLWSTLDLDRRLGPRRQGDWWVTIERPSRALYVVRISYEKGGPEFLWTALYRPRENP